MMGGMMRGRAAEGRLLPRLSPTQTTTTTHLSNTTQQNTTRFTSFLDLIHFRLEQVRAAAAGVCGILVEP